MRSESRFVPTKVTLVSILLCSMLMLMGGAAVAPALPIINEVFPGSDFLVSLIITLPSLSVAIFGFVVGTIADRLGKVKVLVASLLIFFLCGVAGFFIGETQADLYILLVLRFILGIGIAGITCCVTALIADYYGGIQRAKVMSYQSAAMGVGILILEFTGGTLAEITWREPFLVYLIGVPIMLMVLGSMRETSKTDVAINASTGRRPANRKLILVCYIAIFVLQTMSFLMPTKMPYYLEGIGVSSSIVGLFLGVHGISNALVSLMYGRLSSRLPVFVIMGAGFLFMGVGLSLLFINGSVAMSVVVMIFTGIGLGLTVPSVANTLAGEATGSTSGKIMGGYSTCLNLGQFAISLISVPLFSVVGSSYPNMFLVMGVIAILMGLAFVLANRSRPSRSASAA